MDGAEEVASGLVVAGGDGTELLELGEEVLDQVPCFVEMPVIIALVLPVRFGWDDGRLACRSQWFQYAGVSIEGAVGDQRVSRHVGQQCVSTGEIMGLATRQSKADGIAKRIHQSVDLGAQATLAAPDRLLVPPFLWAPAACW